MKKSRYSDSQIMVLFDKRLDPSEAVINLPVFSCFQAMNVQFFLGGINAEVKCLVFFGQFRHNNHTPDLQLSSGVSAPSTHQMIGQYLEKEPDDHRRKSLNSARSLFQLVTKVGTLVTKTFPHSNDSTKSTDKVHNDKGASSKLQIFKNRFSYPRLRLTKIAFYSAATAFFSTLAAIFSFSFIRAD